VFEYLEDLDDGDLVLPVLWDDVDLVLPEGFGFCNALLWDKELFVLDTL